MTLNEFVAAWRMCVYESLSKGEPPPEGNFDEAVWREALAKGAPQMGPVRYEPDVIVAEFAYPVVGDSPLILQVRLDAPERIVFLPVPPWVIESIWQGDIDGSFHFESHAVALVDEFRRQLEPDANLGWFGPRLPKRRE